MNLLEVKNICKTYGNGETAVKALKDVSFSVPKGEYVAIVGESGSGKSTLLNMIGALDTPTSGKVLIDGKDIFSMNDKKLTVFRRRNIGFIFQAFNLVPELTVEQNIIFPVLLDYQKPDKKYLEEHPEMQKKLIRKLIQKQRIKREYQMAYRAGKIAKETKDTSIRSVNLATKIARKAQEVFVRNVTTLISMGLLLILLLSVMTGFASCSAMFSNGISTVIASSYIADPDEIEKAELYYTQLEASLQQKINQMEARYPGKDEYRYNIGEIGHDPHTLISYLTARYGDFKFDEIKGELETIFSLQYGITVEEKSETRQETSTIQVGQSLGNVVTSGYCNCPICCGVWSGGPTASGAMPQANHTLAVDAANPFLPMGTKVVMNGIEYTVEDTGLATRLPMP